MDGRRGEDWLSALFLLEMEQMGSEPLGILILLTLWPLSANEENVIRADGFIKVLLPSEYCLLLAWMRTPFCQALYRHRAKRQSSHGGANSHPTTVSEQKPSH